MFVLHPDQYLLPDYKISPFRTEDIRHHRDLPDDSYADTYFTRRFDGRKFMYTTNGRSAISKALRYLSPGKQDVVTILTSTGNHYVSGCVTSEIEKCCRWNREVNAETKVIFVVHEFGYPYPRLAGLREYGIPIIEDVAYAFYSEDAEHSIGRIGDFVLYSFPKMFSIQVGGLLVMDPEVTMEEECWPGPEWLPYIRKVMSHELSGEEEVKRLRIRNYLALRKKVKPFGFYERFSLEEGVIPGVFMFTVEDSGVDLKKLRDHFFAHGVQCSVFYGERAFFIPVHQALSEVDLDFFVAVLQSFLK